MIGKNFAIEEHFDSDPASYYEAFRVVDKQSKNIGQRDLTYWLEYFTHALAVELARIKDKVKRLSMDTRLKVKIGKQIALTERQMKLVEYLSNAGSCVMRDLQRVLPMVSEDTILRDLKDLMEKGIVRKEGSTKASRYIMEK
jgi:predicted HTH transcriptional regulator